MSQDAQENTDSVFGPQDEFRLSGRLAYLRMLMRRSDAGRRQGHRGAGGSHGRGRVLRLLSLHSPISQKELAYLLGIRSQSLAEHIAKLEELGLVERNPDPQDRRTSVVELTDAGRNAVENDTVVPETDPFAVLSDQEKQQLASLLDKAIAGIEDTLPEGPDPRMQAFKRMVIDGEEPGPEFRGFGPGFGRRHGGPGGRGGRGRHFRP
jgi:DNA-binding MarR family transcriptional regulator